MSWSAISSTLAPAVRTSRKSVSAYRTARALYVRERPLHNNRSHGSGTSGTTSSTASLRSDGFLEIDFRDLFGFFGHFVEGVFLEAKNFRRDVRGELLGGRVVLLHALVVSHAFHRNPVLGARELVHQPVELFIRFELRVIFDDSEQASERAGLRVGGGDALLRRSRREQPRSRVGDVLEDALFVRREPLHRFDKVGNEIVA